VGTSVTINNSNTLKAIAYMSGMTDSPITSASYVIGPEVVSPPPAPSGPTPVIVGTQNIVTYTTGVATDSYGNPVQYWFDWGDGSNTDWLQSGILTATHAWSSQGMMQVKVRARSATNPMVVSAFSQPLNVNMVIANFQISKILFADVDSWTLTLNTNTTLPSTTFNICGIHTPPGGPPGCGNWWNQTTDSTGYWTQTSPLSSNEDGSWQEWVTIPGVPGQPAVAGQSNTISFTVSAPSLNLSICRIVSPTATDCISSGTSFHLGDYWKITLTTNLVSYPFFYCGSNDGTLPCPPTTNLATDNSGNWSQTGYFDSNTPQGTWTQQAQFQVFRPRVVNSNIISFTVSP
jgi:hypothetical protein